MNKEENNYINNEYDENVGEELFEENKNTQEPEEFLEESENTEEGSFNNEKTNTTSNIKQKSKFRKREENNNSFSDRLKDGIEQRRRLNAKEITEEKEDATSKKEQADKTKTEDVKKEKTSENPTEKNMATSKPGIFTRIKNSFGKGDLKGKATINKNKMIMNFLIKYPVVLFILAIIIVMGTVLLLLFVNVVIDEENEKNSSISSNQYGYQANGNIDGIISEEHSATTETGTDSSGNTVDGYTAKDGVIGPDITETMLNEGPVKTFIENNEEISEYISKDSNGNYYFEEGTFVPKDLIDQIQIILIEDVYTAGVEAAAKELDLNLTFNQEDAIVSLSYSLGKNVAKEVLIAYNGDDYEKMIDEILKLSEGSNLSESYVEKLVKLFLTANYQDPDIFDKGLDEYDNDELNDLEEEHNIANNVGLSGFIIPTVPAGRCTSPFGWRTLYDNGVAYQDNHKGLDLAPPVSGTYGSSIVAIADGTVTVARDGINGFSKANSAGNYIIIDHGNGVSSRYLHMQVYTLKVKTGDKVEQGQLLGKMGNTGWSYGVHLHFDIYVNGVQTDPANHLMDLFTANGMMGTLGSCQK